MLKTELRTVDEQSFNAAVVEPLPVAAKTLEHEWADPLLVALCQIETDDADVEERRDVLIGGRMNANKKAQQLIESEARKRDVELVARHEDLKRECRKHTRVIDELRIKVTEAMGGWNKAIELRAEASARLVDAERKRKNLSRFATRAEIASADAAIEREREKVARANEAEARALQLRNDLVLTQLPPLQKKMQAIATEELRLYARITGVGYTDPELGIVVPARSKGEK